MMQGFYRIPSWFSPESLVAELSANGLLDYEQYKDFELDPDSPIYDLLKENQALYKRALGPTGHSHQSGYRQYSFTKFNRIESSGRKSRQLRNLLIEQESASLIEARLTPSLSALLERIPGRYGRVRLALLKSGAVIKPHRDFGSKHLLRVHLPLITNSKCLFFIKEGGKELSAHLPADGSIYTFNVGQRHWVENRGSEPRLHIIVDCFEVKFRESFELYSREEMP